MASPHRTAGLVLKCVFPLALAASFFAAVYLRFYSGLVPAADSPAWPAYLAYLAFSMLVWMALEMRLPVALPLLEGASLGRWFGRLAQLDVLTLAVVSTGTFFWREYSFSRWVVGAFWIFHLLLSLSFAAALRAWWLGRLGQQRTEIWLAGDEIGDRQLYEYGRNSSRAIDIQRVAGPKEIMRRLAERDPGRQEILVALGSNQLDFFGQVSRLLRNARCRAGLLLPAEEFGALDRKGSLFLIPVRGDATESPDYVVSKRIVDLALATAGVVLLAPVMLATGALIAAILGRPLLISQQRVGRGGRPFQLYKFRTLETETLERSDHEWTVAPTTRLGAFLRSTGLDELPQLFNVIRGDMSLVGPRPERPHFVERFQSELPFYSTRHRLQVGITGWAQVNGWRGDTSIARRIEYDLHYLNHWSLAFDLWILAVTVAGFSRNVWHFARTGVKTRHAGAL